MRGQVINPQSIVVVVAINQVLIVLRGLAFALFRSVGISADEGNGFSIRRPLERANAAREIGERLSLAAVERNPPELRAFGAGIVAVFLRVLVLARGNVL